MCLRRSRCRQLRRLVRGCCQRVLPCQVAAALQQGAKLACSSVNENQVIGHQSTDKAHRWGKAWLTVPAAKGPFAGTHSQARSPGRRACHAAASCWAPAANSAAVRSMQQNRSPRRCLASGTACGAVAAGGGGGASPPQALSALLQGWWSICDQAAVQSATANVLCRAASRVLASGTTQEVPLGVRSVDQKT